jgi:hypothetical protein
MLEKRKDTDLVPKETALWITVFDKSGRHDWLYMNERVYIPRP